MMQPIFLMLQKVWWISQRNLIMLLTHFHNNRYMNAMNLGNSRTLSLQEK